MFEEIYKHLPLEVNPENIYPNIGEYSIPYIKDRLFNLDKLSDEEAYNLIRKTYPFILDEMFIAKNMDLISFLYTNPRFIMTFTNVLSRPDVQLNHLQMIYCNRLAYDYFTARGEKNEYIYALMINLGKTVNRAYVPSLIGLGLNETLAVRLVNARFSTLKEIIQVKRMNLIIMNQPTDVMTVQMIVDIYGKLFDKITPLFSGIMYDYLHKDSFMNQEMEDVYATINIVILEIVNNLPEDIMYHLLRNFYESHQMMNPNTVVRFNIYSFSPEDYPRLNYTLELLKREGIVLPM